MPLSLCSLVLAVGTACLPPVPTTDGAIQAVFSLRHDPVGFRTALLVDRRPTHREAQDVVLSDGYVALLGPDDRRNSEGARLEDAASIVRQDRFNVHTATHRDAQDTVDRTFATKERREKLAEAVNSSENLPWLQAAVDGGNPTIDVRVEGDRIDVRLLSTDDGSENLASR